MNDEKITRRQFMTMASVAVFTPIVRLVPNRVAYIAGPAGWAAVLASVPVVLLLLWAFVRFYGYNDDGEGLAHLFIKALGKTAGRAVSLIYGLWLLVYSGFILRASSERFLSGVYENGSLPFFIITMMLLVTMASLQKLRTLARSAQIFLIIMTAILGGIFVFAMPDIKMDNLLPVSILDTKNILLAVVTVVNSVSPWIYMTFLSNETLQDGGRFKSAALWMLAVLAMILLMVLSTTGNFGAELSSRLQNPFFSMVRDVKIFDLLERVETVVILLWVATDFMFLSALLMSSGEALRISMGAKDRRPFVAVGAGAMLAVSFLIAPNAFALSDISARYIPRTNLLFVFGGLPLIYVIGKIRKKLSEKGLTK